jgi:hypothetical protein
MPHAHEAACVTPAPSVPSPSGASGMPIACAIVTPSAPGPVFTGVVDRG